MNANIDISDVILKTERLTIRPWKESDLDDFFEYASVPGVGEAAGWSHHETKEESKTILDMFINEKKTFAIEYNGKAIGSIGIEKYNEEIMPELDDKSGREIGFVLSKDHWGKGLMPEAVAAVIKWLFDEVNVNYSGQPQMRSESIVPQDLAAELPPAAWPAGLDFIVCGHSPNNLRSKRVQEKCGFKPYKMSEFKTTWGEVRESFENILFKEERYEI